MTMPRRFAALAMCLLALASGAAAADCNTQAGYFFMELMDVTGTGADSHEVATCLTSVKVTVAGSGCVVTLDSSAAGSVYLPALWATQTNYAQYQECPATSAEAAKGAGTADTAAGAHAGVLSAINKFAYQGLKDFSLASIVVANGIITVQDVAGGSPALKFVYAVKESTVAGVPAITSADLSGLSSDAQEANLGDSCATGRYGIVVSSEITSDEFKLCPLCPAGTYGDGDGCTACAAGSASAIVGKTSACTACGSKGTYAQEGSSVCLPCPTGTYQDQTGQSECKECPNDSYAWIPGSAGCLRCIQGVPTCVAGDIDGFTCAASGSAGSPGYHVLKFGVDVDTAQCDALSTTYEIKAYDQCTSWHTTPASGQAAAIQLSVYVNGDCSVTVSPITDTSCADGGAVSGATKLSPLSAGTYGYTYNELLLQAYYATPTSIRSLLPSTNGGATSSMLGIDSTSATTATIKFWAATNKPDDAATLVAKTGADASCSVVALAAGGKVFSDTTAVNPSSCPAGSYGVDNQYCLPCPQGYTCSGGKAKAACTADYANPYLGAPSCTACTTNGPPRTLPTSYTAAAYCTVPYLSRDCTTDGTFWDESAAKCLDCPAGTYRAGNDANQECQPCSPGYYSGAGAGACYPCPAGQYSPSAGLPDQATAEEPTRHCLRCPTGSIALTAGESVNLVTDNSVLTSTDDYRNNKALPQAATVCLACPDGTYANKANTEAAPTGTEGSYVNTATSCTLCPAGTYRTGDASPQNNVCNPLPNGYKVKTALIGSTLVGSYQCISSSTTACVGAFEVEACSAGTVASWNSGRTVRNPTTPMTCAPCAANTYAPKTGLSVCIACKGGFRPTKIGNPAATDGFDQCVTACSSGTYRSFYTAQATCGTCYTAGFESGPSGRTACTQCRPGTYSALRTGSESTDVLDNCQPCPQNRFMARPGASACDVCPRGHETQDTGNTACDPCSVGFFKSTAGATSCVKAPAGTFVNTSAAYFATPCPLGTYTNEQGQDSCDSCPPGQYANALGSRACKTCPAGTFSNGQASTCRACEQGYYSVPGSGACSPCKPGTYTDSARAGTCKLCPKGYQCPTPATKTPRACPAGTYASKDGAVLCTPCPVNTISTTTGSKQCTACGTGTNTRGLTGQTRCQTTRATSLRRSVL